MLNDRTLAKACIRRGKVGEAVAGQARRIKPAQQVGEPSVRATVRFGEPHSFEGRLGRQRPFRHEGETVRENIDDGVHGEIVVAVRDEEADRGPQRGGRPRARLTPAFRAGVPVGAGRTEGVEPLPQAARLPQERPGQSFGMLERPVGAIEVESNNARVLVRQKEGEVGEAAFLVEKSELGPNLALKGEPRFVKDRRRVGEREGLFLGGTNLPLPALSETDGSKDVVDRDRDDFSVPSHEYSLSRRYSFETDGRFRPRQNADHRNGLPVESDRLHANEVSKRRCHTVVRKGEHGAGRLIIVAADHVARLRHAQAEEAARAVGTGDDRLLRGGAPGFLKHRAFVGRKGNSHFLLVSQWLVAPRTNGSGFTARWRDVAKG